jgi:hypothetical protein
MTYVYVSDLTGNDVWYVLLKFKILSRQSPRLSLSLNIYIYIVYEYSHFILLRVKIVIVPY